MGVSGNRGRSNVCWRFWTFWRRWLLCANCQHNQASRNVMLRLVQAVNGRCRVIMLAALASVLELASTLRLVMLILHIKYQQHCQVNTS